MPKPNIVFIYADDLGYHDLGYMGSDYYETPEIDALSQQGKRFTRAYTNPTCAPSRASLLTGKYTPRHSIYTVDNFAKTPDKWKKVNTLTSEKKLELSDTTWAEILHRNGYTLGHFGKWHLGGHEQNSPTQQGFDINIGGGYNGSPVGGGYFSPYTIPAIENGPEGEFLTDRLTSEAISFIEKNKDNHFFVYLPYYTVHVPLQAPQDVVEYFKNKPPGKKHNHPVYAAMIKRMDKNIGRIADKLEELGLKENTIIFFTSDNGGQSMVTSNYPLKGQKGEIHEGGIRVPMFAVWPGKIKANSYCHEPVSVVDFFPTFLELSGTKVPDMQLDGKSLKGILLGGQDKIQRPGIFYHLPCYNGDSIHNAMIWQPPVSAIVDGDWKLVEYYEDNHLELYNLKQDMGETNNLINDHPDKKEELYKKLREWKEEVSAYIPEAIDK